MEKAKQDLDLPTIRAGEHYLVAFSEMGRCSIGGMGGLIAMPWAEINAYSFGHPTIVDHSDRHILRDMSAAYVGGLTLGANALAISPMEREKA